MCTAGFDAGGTCADPGQQIRLPGTGAPVPLNRIPAGQISPISRAFLDLVPGSGTPGPNIGTLELSDTGTADTSRNQVSTRIDYQISGSDQVFGVLHSN